MQSRAEACTPYTEYRGPGLRGAREGPLYSVNFFLNHKKRVGRKKRKKHYTQKAKDVLYLPESLGEFQGLGGPGL